MLWAQTSHDAVSHQYQPASDITDPHDRSVHHTADSALARYTPARNQIDRSTTHTTRTPAGIPRQDGQTDGQIHWDARDPEHNAAACGALQRAAGTSSYSGAAEDGSAEIRIHLRTVGRGRESGGTDQSR